jgi:lipopolysaccharide/colanic/teichoic acid biosynthesis glycosyltransferase
LLLAVMLMISLSWLFLLIAVLYYMQGHRNVIFAQQRTGWKQKPFTLFKFRTLHENAALELHERRFAWGSILRYTSLDELPQLWNIIRGEMSFVGPRPLPTEYQHLYTDEEKQRHQCKPGITGLAQVMGRNSLTWNQKFEYDLYYVRHISPWLDLKIIFKTIALLLSFKRDISLSEEKFKGHA